MAVKTGDILDGDDGGAQPRYAAFISYSHADEAAAKRLHRRLETYRLPPHVRDASERTRIGTIFRDRADLAAASSLTDAIKSALARSRALIVLCSPEAKASPWVDAEIRLFRELHPAAPVLAVILRDEPADAMPVALVEGGREPLAADFRKDSDGEKLGFLKVVAALRALPLDSLIQRDAQRRLRRVIAITVIAVALMLAMLGMTAYAISARNEAQRQRAEAEGLIDYMMTELRTRLRGVGSGEVQRAVSERAMEYYRSQGDLSDLPADSLRRRALILQAMGEDETGRGANEAAMVRFREAYRTTETLLELDPADPDRVFAHAQSAYWVGYVFQLRKDYPQARRQFATYLQLAEQLKAVDPDQDRADREIGFAEGNLCAVEILDKATDHPATSRCTAALAAMKRVADRRPDDPAAQLALANRHAWLALAFEGDGNIEAGIAQLSFSNQMVTDLLRDDPGNADYMDMLVGNLAQLADWQVRQRQFRAAEETIDQGQSILATLLRRDPERTRWNFLARRMQALRQQLRQSQVN